MSHLDQDAGRVAIFDTTLRDGEQAPGIALNVAQKLQIATQLDRLGVDVIEAGYPRASQGDFEAVQAVARANLSCTAPIICAIARADAVDIDRAWAAIKDAPRARINIFLSTSEIHMRHQLRASREDVRGMARAAVAQARALTDDVQFNAMDATRSDAEFLAEIVTIALGEGATTITIADTVGYTTPDEYGELIQRLYELVPALGRVVLSAHCHDDLGLAVANSVAAVRAGARQLECTINGIGERAGNASLEELVMLLHTRADRYRVRTCARTTELTRTSRLVSRVTGYPLAPNKAVVGANAFAHASGIHQDGVLKESSTYQVMDARSVGLDCDTSIVLGKLSGRRGLRSALEDLGYELDGGALNRAFTRFKALADQQGHLTALDLRAIVADDVVCALAA